MHDGTGEIQLLLNPQKGRLGLAVLHLGQPRIKGFLPQGFPCNCAVLQLMNREPVFHLTSHNHPRCLTHTTGDCRGVDCEVLEIHLSAD